MDRSLRADHVIQPHRDGLAWRHADDPTSFTEAVDWFATEAPVLLALVELAARGGFARQTWQLAWALTTYLRRNGRFEDRVSVHRRAESVSRDFHPGDRATVLYHLAGALARIGDYDEAHALLDEALALAAPLPDGRIRVAVHGVHARLLEQEGRFTEALAHADTALELARRGHVPIAGALNSRGRQLYLMGRHAEALPCCREALAMYRSMGQLEGQAAALIIIGNVTRRLGRAREALPFLEEALAIDREVGDLYWEAVCLRDLGDAYRELHEWRKASAVLGQALTIMRRIHHPDSAELDRLLSTVDTHVP